MPLLKVRSSCVLPPMIGMWLNRPVLHACSGVIGTTVPSTIWPVTYGPFAFAVPCSWRISGTDRFRMQAAAASPSPGQPAACAKPVPRLSPSESGAYVEVKLLWKIARWNSPALRGEITLAPVSDAPADWPPRVTLLGSPPKRVMLRWTHRSASWMSIVP
jgi:hypothetical protein